VLMPMIGVIDTMRAQQISQKLLGSISETRARVAILNVTGVPNIDTSVARHLISTVEGAQILGAKVIISGSSPTRRRRSRNSESTSHSFALAARSKMESQRPSAFSAREWSTWPTITVHMDRRVVSSIRARSTRTHEHDRSTIGGGRPATPAPSVPPRRQLYLSHTSWLSSSRRCEALAHEQPISYIRGMMGVDGEVGLSACRRRWILQVGICR
jgi:anti-anti-sigma regulatory factor